MKEMPKPRHDLLKPAFVERYRQLLGIDYDDFITSSFSYLRKSIRTNTIKIGAETLKARLKTRWVLTTIPWCPESYWIRFRGDEHQEERFDIGNLPEHALGLLYIQDAASMLPPVVLQAKPGDIVLDLCAAPGSKTSQLAASMKNEGLLVANDSQSSRLRALGVNLQRIGARNTFITCMHGERFKQFPQTFDKVLVDAPCSGTGTIRKSMKVLEMWSPKLVTRLSKEQRRLIEAGFIALKVGGTMVYSTCTLEPEENEGVVDWLLKTYPDAQLKQINLPCKRTPAFTSYNNVTYEKSIKNCLRLHPQDNDTEGFFVARIHKREK